MTLTKGIIGAVIGDIAGSSHESKPVKTKRFKLFNQNSCVTDDTVLSMAIAEWMLDRDNNRPEDTLIRWAELYPHAGYGSSFKRFLANNGQYMQPGSTHNGAAMRVSPIGFLSNSLEECLELARESALPSHGSDEAIAAAQATAAAIWLARCGSSKEEIKSYISQKFGYDLSRTYDEARAEVHHARMLRDIDYETSHNRIIRASYTVRDSIIAFLAGNSYEEVIKLSIYMGGDADTVAAIAGGIAAAFYGVPQEIIEEALIYIPSEMIDIINRTDGTNWASTGLIPPKSSRWSIKDVVVYGTSMNGAVNEKAYHLTHKTRYSKHFNEGYPIHVIGNTPDRIWEEVQELRRICEKGTHRWHLHPVGLESGTLTYDQFLNLFSWANELDNVLVCPMLK